MGWPTAGNRAGPRSASFRSAFGCVRAVRALAFGVPDSVPPVLAASDPMDADAAFAAAEGYAAEALRAVSRGAEADGQLELSPEPPHALLDIDDGALRLLGRTRSSLLGVPMATLVVPAANETVHELLRRTDVEGSVTGLVPLRPHRGPPLPALLAAVASGDRTELRVEVWDLRELSDDGADPWMRRTVEEMPLGLMVLDPEARLLDWNAAAESMLDGHMRKASDLASAWGYPAEKLHLAVEAAKNGEVRVLGAEEVGSGRARQRITVFPVYDREGHPQRVGLVVEDRSLESELLAERSELERRLRGIFDAIGDAVVVTDRRDHVVAWNPGAEGLYGWREAEAMARPFRSLVQERREVEAGSRTAGELTDGQQWVGRVIHRDRDGRGLELDVVTRALRGPDGQLEGRVAVCRPSSVAGQLDARLIRAERLQALESLAGGMAHEFNNLLGVILSNTAYLGARLAETRTSARPSSRCRTPPVAGRTSPRASAPSRAARRRVPSGPSTRWRRSEASRRCSPESVSAGSTWSWRRPPMRASSTRKRGSSSRCS